MFVWTIREGIDANARYVTITSNATENPTDPSDRVYLNEVCFLDTDGNVITPKNADDSEVSALFDEQDYLTRWNYIDTNPARWAEDEYY